MCACIETKVESEKLKVKDMRKAVMIVAAALALSACGSPPAAAQGFMRDHVLCTPVTYGVIQWSADSASIDYIMATSSQIDLHEMTAQGKSDRLLASDIQYINLSPDGAMMAFERPTPGSGPASEYDAFILDLNTGQILQKLAGIPQVEWSPDSRWVLYSSMRPGGRIFKTNVHTGQTTRLTDLQVTDGYDETPRYSPDGKLLAFASSRESNDPGRTFIFVMAPDGAGLRRLTITDQLACHPTSELDRAFSLMKWLPDGSLVVQENCFSGFVYDVISPDNTLIHNLDWLGEGVSVAAWSPDGSKMAYSIKSPPGRFIANADGSDPVLLGPDVSPWVSWSPDGTQLLFFDLQQDMYLASGDGSGARLLQSRVVDARWSPDGQWIVFTGADASGLYQIYKIRPDGSGLTQLTDNPGSHVCLH